MASEGEGKVYWRVNFVRFDRPQEAGGDRGFGRLPPQSDPSGNVNIVPDSCSTPLLVPGQPGLITEVETFEAGDNLFLSWGLHQKFGSKPKTTNEELQNPSR